MNVLGLFSGIGGFEYGLQKVGYNISALCEIEPYPIQVLKKNFHNIPIVNDVKNITHDSFTDIDVIVGGFPCFTKGTLIYTDVGYKDICDIKVNDLVLTHNNKFKRVVKTGINNKEIYTLKCQGILPTNTTKDHPYYVITKSGIWNNKLRKYTYMYSNPQWKPAHLLTKNDYIGNNINELSENDYNLSEEDCWLVGRYIADGHIDNYKIIYSIGSHKLENFKCNVKRKLHYHLHTTNCYRGILCSKSFLELLTNIDCGVGAKNKVFSNKLLNLPNHLLKIVIDGYLSGDGYLDKNDRWNCVSISKKLITSLSVAISKVYGIGSNVYKNKVNNTTVIEGRTVNQSQTYSLTFKIGQGNSILLYNKLWTPVKSIINLKKMNIVYNIEVDLDHSFTANNAIVHNCTDISRAGKMNGGINGENSGLWYEFRRIINEIKPKYAIIENVNSILGNGIETVLSNLSECGYDATWQTLDTKYFGLPQRRSRVYIIAVRDGIPDNTEIFKYKEHHTAKCRKTIQSIKEGFEWDFTKIKNSKERFAFFTRQRSDEFACTGLSSCLMKRDYKDFTDLVYQYGNLRRVTPEERMLLQGFPKDWLVDGTKTDQYKCNGMSVPVIEYIGTLLKEFDDVVKDGVYEKNITHSKLF